MLTINQINSILLLSLFVILKTTASTVCYSEQNYPAVHFLGLNEKQWPRVALVGRNIDWQTNRAPILEQTESGWVDAGEKACHPSWKCLMRKERCAVAIPKIDMTVKEATKYRDFHYLVDQVEQKVSACNQVGDEVYFGIEFYEGEGVNGVGGIGKYNVKTKKMEIRRLLPLQNTSVTNLVFDGNDLWISASSHYECEGMVPEVPLLRYNWDKNRIYSLHKQGFNFCGFNVHDMHYHNDKLYIASDMGFTIGWREKVDYGDGASYEWQPFRHYVPDRNNPDKMVRMSCEALYEDMLRESSTKNSKQLIEALIKYKPDYMIDKFLRLNKQAGND